MPNNFMVSVEPEYDVITRLIAAWVKPILDVAAEYELSYLDLYKEQAKPYYLYSAIESTDPLIVNISAHGEYNLIHGQDGQNLVIPEYSPYFVNRNIFDMSCSAGRDLGKFLVENGATSFLGYVEPFWFWYETWDPTLDPSKFHQDGGLLNPLEDPYIKGFMETHNIAPISFIKGSSPEECYSNSQALFDYWMNIWGDLDMNIYASLFLDKEIQVLYTSTPRLSTSKLPLVLSFIPLILIPLFRKFK